MKDEFVAGLFIAGGIGVLMTYIFLYITGTLGKLAKMFTANLWRIWILSMLLTATSVLAIFFYFSTKERVEKDVRGMFITALCIFLFSAMAWSLSVEYIERYNKDPALQRWPLMFTAMASLLILVSVALTTKNWALILAAVVVLIHHTFIDGLVWPKLHEVAKLRVNHFGRQMMKR